MRLFHPECVLEEPAEIPDGATYHGREGIARFFQGVYGEVWDEWRIVPTEIISGPDGVFAAVHNSGRSKSGAEVEMQVFRTDELTCSSVGGRTLRLRFGDGLRT